MKPGPVSKALSTGDGPLTIAFISSTPLSLALLLTRSVTTLAGLSNCVSTAADTRLIVPPINPLNLLLVALMQQRLDICAISTKTDPEASSGKPISYGTDLKPITYLLLLLVLLLLLLLLLSSCLPVHCIPLVARPSLEVARGIANWLLTRLARLLLARLLVAKLLVAKLLVASRPICWCLMLPPILLLLFNWPVGWSRWRLLTEAIWLLVEEERPLVVELERPLLVEETSPLEATGLGRPIPTVCGCCR